MAACSLAAPSANPWHSERGSERENREATDFGPEKRAHSQDVAFTEYLCDSSYSQDVAFTEYLNRPSAECAALHEDVGGLKNPAALAVAVAGLRQRLYIRVFQTLKAIDLKEEDQEHASSSEVTGGLSSEVSRDGGQKTPVVSGGGFEYSMRIRAVLKLWDPLLGFVIEYLDFPQVADDWVGL